MVDLRHGAPRGRDWVHVDDFVREASALGVEVRPRLYVDLGLVEAAQVLGGSGFYLKVEGFDFATDVGPEEMRKLLAALEASARLKLEVEPPTPGVGSVGEED